MRNARSFLTVLFLVSSLVGALPAIAAEDTSPPSVTSHEVNVVRQVAIALAVGSDAVRDLRGPPIKNSNLDQLKLATPGMDCGIHRALLEIVAAATSEKSSERSRAQLEQLAVQAAERGDSAAVQSLAKELEHYRDEVEKNGFESAPSAESQYECRFDIETVLPTNTNTPSRELGLVETHVPALPEVRAAVEVIYAHAWDPTPSTPELEHEGVLRTEVLAESQVPAQFVTEEFRILAEQFIQQIFINSGGARYLPRISAEAALVEDFAESEAADSPSQLLSALGLPRRRGLARAEIENALMRFGAQIVADQLKLNPLEFRLVCIPYDLYMRLGRERNWGHWHHWTHFDGYQVVHGNRLRALVGGDGRFGGVADLVSISRTDAHDSVYARFAVVRRARMVARWR